MHTNSVTARLVLRLIDKAMGDDPSGEPAVRGDIEVKPNGMWVCCPGCGNVSLLEFGVSGGSPPAPQRWQLVSTDPAKPTLKPSIHHPGCWHGWLTDGEFVSC